jgi:hypothetical protein
VYLVDALGWEILGASGALANRGDLYARKLRTVLGYSAGAIPTILTGLLPQEHGRWSLLRWSPEHSPFAWTRWLRPVPTRLLAHRYARKAIDLVSKRVAGAEGYFSSYGLPVRQLSNFDVCETTNIYRPGGIREAENIFDRFEALGAEYRAFSYHDGADEKLAAKLEDEVRAGGSGVYFVYLAKMDEFLHLNGCEGPEVDRCVRWYIDRMDQTAQLAAERGAEVRTFLFSDHGMTPVRERFDLIERLRRAGLDPEEPRGEPYYAVFDATLARFWTGPGPLRAKLAQTLEDCPAGRVLSREELRDLGVYFPDGRYGNLIFLMNPGVLISPNLFGSHAPLGMHGYHPEDAHSWASYVSNVEHHRPESIADLHGILAAEAAWTLGGGR